MAETALCGLVAAVGVGTVVRAEVPLAEPLLIGRRSPVGFFSTTCRPCTQEAAELAGRQERLAAGIVAVPVHMLALIRMERPMEAIASYERCRTILSRELGVEPCGRLRRLATSIGYPS
ncbi:BTAD domain-containing putative transcriptional regulator [Dactylosporangium sp. NPDC051484]|uniref:BTAD domain-containing putative transcriptional regulator n=1 Tax=Dactylosporangium sp. NPDC051484 TaxID=3154942 RepID=UPI00344CC20A